MCLDDKLPGITITTISFKNIMCLVDSTSNFLYGLLDREDSQEQS